MAKLDDLKKLLQDMPGVLVAYSGGVDSTFLAYVANQVLGERALAITAVSPTYPEQQLEEARSIAANLGLRHQVIRTTEFESENFTTNPPDRCYHCKLALFGELHKLAQENNLAVIIDGANADDKADFRPGHKAAREYNIRSPLQEAGFTKEEIRAASKELNLPTWNKPAYACLASRIPYGTPITLEALNRIDKGESYLQSLGFEQVRLRDHFPLARVEVLPSELENAWRQRATIAAKLHEIGFTYVTLDLDGFRSGSMNEVLGQNIVSGDGNGRK